MNIRFIGNPQLRGYFLVFSFFLSALFTDGKISAQCQAIKSGNWNDPTVWSCGIEPTSILSVTIATGYTVTVNVGNAVCSTLQLGLSGVGDGTIAFNSGSQLTVGGAVTFGTTGGGAKNGYANMTNGGYLKCSSIIDNGGSITYGTGTIEYTGAFTLSSKADFCKYYNLVINSSGTITMSAYFIYMAQ